MEPTQRKIEGDKSILTARQKSKRRVAGQKALRIWRLRRFRDKEPSKTKSVPAPFVLVQVNNKRESMLMSLLLLFAIVQCICGFVFPICDTFALTDKWTQFAINHKYYMEGFLLIQYIGGILSLAYLQILIYCFLQPRKGNLLESHGRSLSLTSGTISASPRGFRSGVIKSKRVSVTPDLTESTFHSGTKLSAAPVASNGTKWEYLTWHEEGMNLYMRLGAVGFGLGVMISDGFSLSSAWELSDPFCHSSLWIPKHSLRLLWVLWQTYFVFKYHRVVLHAYNFTVRIAFTHLAVINLCHWLNAVLGEISETLKNGDIRDNSSTNAVLELLSSMSSTHGIQPVLVRDNTTDRAQAEDGFGLNASVLLAELRSQLNLTKLIMENHRRPVANCKTYLGQLLRPFLFPFAIEYSLITGTLFYKLLQRVGDKSSEMMTEPLGVHCMTGSVPSLQMPSISPFNMASFPTYHPSLTSSDNCGYIRTICEEHRSYRQILGCRVFLPPLKEDSSGKDSPESNKSPFKSPHSRLEQRNLDSYCHRSHTGLFLGLMLFLATVTGIILFLGRNKHNVEGMVPHLYQYSMMIVLTVGVFTGLMAIIQTNQLKFKRITSSESFEYNLLSLGLVGCLTYHMLLFVPSLETIVHVFVYRSAAIQSRTDLKLSDWLNTSNLDHMTGTAWLYIVKCSLEVFHALIQFFFIVEATRRGPCCPNQSAIKPGRSAIVFLLITNLALWLINTFEVRQMENRLALHRQYYGIRTWSIITCCLVPLIIFFRFHSTVCLAQLWSTLYKLR